MFKKKRAIRYSVKFKKYPDMTAQVAKAQQFVLFAAQHGRACEG
jgi:hypothetical protein